MPAAAGPRASMLPSASASAAGRHRRRAAAGERRGFRCGYLRRFLRTAAALTTAFAFGAAPAARGQEIEVNKPFQLIRPTADHSSILPVPESLARLARHNEHISVLSVVGPYHSGKSFLLNALVGNPEVFTVGRRTSPETMGIWLCRTEMRASDGSEVWLMDSEGFFGPGVTETYDAKIFTLASLLGGHLVYNTVKIIDQQAVNLLEMLARRAQLFRTRSSAEAAGLETPEFLSVRSFPPLTWVVEDFIQELPVEYRYEDGATAWLRSYLSKANASDEGDSEDPHFLSRIYSDLRVHTLFLPATSREHLTDLSLLSWEQLTPEFRTEVTSLREQILEKLEARRVEGQVMTGKTLERSVRFMVQALQRGMFHELPSLWKTWSQQVSEMSLQDADTWFSSLMAKIDSHEDPIPVREFNEQVEDAREKAMQFYTELLRDFEVHANMPELQNRMTVQFQSKLMHYHERIQRWVSELIGREKDAIGKVFSSIEIPVHPEVLKTSGENATRHALRRFSGKISDFSRSGEPVKLGRAAGMPVFSQDPVAQLTNDIKALLAMRELENEREIMMYFKAAVVAADEVVDQELKANQKRLVGNAAMKDLRALLSAKCWQAFDERLARHAWLMSAPHYKTFRAQVQTETLEGRLARFHAANEQRLSAHFRTSLERCVGAYSTRKANLAMPVSEGDLEAEHRGLASSVRDMLGEQGRELVDTEAYRGALRSLGSVLEDGYQHIKAKNVELWKVHSDEATRCALRLNQDLERHCGLTCLFNKVPRTHKTTSFEHLISCLSRSGTASRMSPAMQLKVFENWYDKDLAHDADAVWNNFYLGFGSCFVGLCGFAAFCGLCGCCASRWSPPPQPAYYGRNGVYY
eukprot:TRINITY_DN18899_c0_g1_i1.p1 TRINITY_DN18899_c0_g1~~TRINITY_DN18899_c0_g1_i1.p1  ORF type:complete len:866 (+),score=178.07 TRINITY_DN18899_c0_g1_i1:128-2725(+)